VHLVHGGFVVIKLLLIQVFSHSGHFNLELIQVLQLLLRSHLSLSQEVHSGYARFAFLQELQFSGFHLSFPLQEVHSGYARSEFLQEGLFSDVCDFKYIKITVPIIIINIIIIKILSIRKKIYILYIIYKI
jgi:hypothetical protein